MNDIFVIQNKRLNKRLVKFLKIYARKRKINMKYIKKCKKMIHNTVIYFYDY